MTFGFFLLLCHDITQNGITTSRRKMNLSFWTLTDWMWSRWLIFPFHIDTEFQFGHNSRWIQMSECALFTWASDKGWWIARDEDKSDMKKVYLIIWDKKGKKNWWSDIKTLINSFFLIFFLHNFLCAPNK